VKICRVIRIKLNQLVLTFKKCPYYRYLIEKVTFSDIRIANISQSLPHRRWKTADMKKLRHCHLMYMELVCGILSTFGMGDYRHI